MKTQGTRILVAIALVLALVPAARASSYSFVTFDYPGGAFVATDVLGINNLGQISGSCAVSGNPTVFVRATDGSFSTVGIPGTGKTGRGINDAGQLVGTSDSHGYIKDTVGGALTLIDYPGASNTATFGINDAGRVVGFYNNNTMGYMYDIAGNSWTQINKNGASITQAYGITDSGLIVGMYTLAGHDNGFTYDNGTFTDLNFPGAQNTRAVGINDQGDIVGRYWNDGGVIHGFLYHGGTSETITMPGADILRVSGINNSGQIVGFFTTDGGLTVHGFEGNPVPLPGTLLLLGSGLAGLAAFRRKFN